MTARSSRGRAAIVGVGFSEVSRRSDRPAGQLAVEASRRALADAGLELEDVDGLSTYPNPSRIGAGTVDGVDFVGTEYLARALRLESLTWHSELTRGTITCALINAANAVLAGACTHVLAWRAMHNPPGKYGQVAVEEVRGDDQYTTPYGFHHEVVSAALPYSQYMARYNVSRQDMAPFVVRNRQRASDNPNAVWRGQPITEEDYLAARMIAEPLSLLDCDMPVDGCTAFVVTTEERAKDLKQKPVVIVGSTALGLPPHRRRLATLEDYRTSAAQVVSATWASAGLGPADITHAHLYDGFIHFVPLLLEAFGFCEEGEAPNMLKDDCTSLTGRLPVNTSGGNLGMGRLHGTGHVADAMFQIRGTAGPRQIPHPGVGLAVTGNPLTGCGSLVLAES